MSARRSIAVPLLWAAQTPQVFRADALRAALDVDAGVRDAATDEAMLVEATGGRILIHPTSPENLKVTTPLDLRVAELLLADRPAGPTSVPEQDPDQGRGEAELADAEGDSEADRAEQRGGGGSEREGEQEQEQLAGHCGGSLGAARTGPAGRFVLGWIRC